jgi:hypothetical protein
MPIKPEKVTMNTVTANAAQQYRAEATNANLEGVSNMRLATAQILNTIRDNASTNYRDYIPEADPISQASVRQIGGIIMNTRPYRMSSLTHS